jgi:hypothetical protein
MADETTQGVTPGANGTATPEIPENGVETAQGVYWRNKDELQKTIVGHRDALRRVEELEKRLAEVAAPKPEKKGDAKPDETDFLLRKDRFRDALEDYALNKTERQTLKEWFDEAKPENPSEWLKAKVERLGYGKTPAAQAADDSPPPNGTATVPKVGNGAPGRDPGGVMQGSAMQFAKQNPAAWRALTPQQRMEWTAKSRASAEPRADLLPANRIKAKRGG